MTGLQHCCKVVNTEIGDPLLNNSQQAKRGTGEWHHNALRKHIPVTPVCLNMQHKLTHGHTTDVHDTFRPCTLNPAHRHPTYVVPVLWVQLEFCNEVTCHLTMTELGCPVQHGTGGVCLLMDPFSKQRQQELDDLNVPSLCSQVHDILAGLHQVTIQVQDTVLARLFVVETSASMISGCKIWKMAGKANKYLVELLESTKRISKYSTE